MKKIPLTRGRFALVDDEDFEELNKYKWCMSAKGYAVRTSYTNDGKALVRMHQAIMGIKAGHEIDHIFGNTLDNRKSQLRFVTPSQNCMNRKIRHTSKSGLKGIDWNKNSKKWRARITLNNKTISLGLFVDKNKARDAYDAAAIKYHGEFAKTNKDQLQ